MDMKREVWFWVLGWMLTILTVPGNGLVIYFIISRRRLHNTVNWLLLSLALADLCVGLNLFPTMTVCSQSVCNECTTTALRWLFLNLSMTNLCALTIDRCIAIVSPFKYAVFKTKKLRFLLLVSAWFLPFLFHFAPFTWMYCAGLKTAVRHFLTVILFTFKLPPFLLVLFTACSKTLYALHKQKKRASVQLSQLKFNGLNPVQMKTLSSQTQAGTFAKDLGIIVAIFLICYAIDISRLICYTFHCTKYIPDLLVQVQDLLFIFNSASNPLVYAFLKQDIRQELKLFLKCLVS